MCLKVHFLLGKITIMYHTNLATDQKQIPRCQRTSAGFICAHTCRMLWRKLTEEKKSESNSKLLHLCTLRPRWSDIAHTLTTATRPLHNGYETTSQWLESSVGVSAETQERGMHSFSMTEFGNTISVTWWGVDDQLRPHTAPTRRSPAPIICSSERDEEANWWVQYPQHSGSPSRSLLIL